MSLISNGLYKILNVQYPTLDADLLFGQPNATIVGYTINSNSSAFVWNLTNVGNQFKNEFTLTNEEKSSNGAYASVDQIIPGAGLHGSTNATIWTAIQTFNPNQYQILAPALTSPFGTVPSPLVWSLDSDNPGTQIKLRAASIANLSQVWTFQAVKDTNSARELNALD